jgi:hypothetical protein
MATTVFSTRPAKHILMHLTKASTRRAKRYVWISSGAAPAVDSADYASYPVKVGDLCVCETVGVQTLYVCSVAPQATTNATFVAIST